MNRHDRLLKANVLLVTISQCGRGFFLHRNRVARFEIRRQRVWWVDHYSLHPTYTHYAGPWRHFTGGGTLRCLAKRLAKYIFRGDRLPADVFGPWPDDFCNGDLWGYGADMEQVRQAARKLGIVE